MLVNQLCRKERSPAGERSIWASLRDLKGVWVPRGILVAATTPSQCYHCGALRSSLPACSLCPARHSLPPLPQSIPHPRASSHCCLHGARHRASITREPLTHTRALPDRLGLLALPPAAPSPRRAVFASRPHVEGDASAPPTPAPVVQAVLPELVTQLLPLHPRAWRLRFPHAHRDAPCICGWGAAFPGQVLTSFPPGQRRCRRRKYSRF